jgi:hypothetical protein
MKKLFFSAVALVAFSSVSMANNIEIKEIKLKKVLIVENTTPTECSAIKFYYYNHLTSQGVPHDEASARSYRIYFQCMAQALTPNTP